MEGADYWVAVAAGVVINILHSPGISFAKALTGAATGVFMAHYFTVPVAYMLDVDNRKLQLAIAAVLALCGNGIAQMLIDRTGRADWVLDLIKAWRGR